MILLLSLALSALAQLEEMEEIRITGYEMSGLQNRETVIRGTCHGRPASATIGMIDLRSAHPERTGRVMLRAGRWVRQVPRAFLHGNLIFNGINWTGLACDGRRLKLNARAVRRDDGGEIVMDAQEAILDLRTGIVTMTELRTLSPAETRSELPGLPRLPH